jgi:UTP:GlnB (protein PII) uridylyltransferase
MAKHYTKPKLRERIKNRIMRSSKGGRPGQWSARKSQLLAKAYKKAGGGYRGGKTKAAKSLTRWTKQKWRTKSGKPSLKTGERYLPERLVKSMTSSQYAYETRKKRAATKKGKQSAKYSKRTTKRIRRYT